MASKKNHVVLDQDQHVYLKKMITSGTESARKLTHARILMKPIGLLKNFSSAIRLNMEVG